jgi:mannosyl-oligosaccharide alpha-1,2-mannosidase
MCTSLPYPTTTPFLRLTCHMRVYSSADLKAVRGVLEKLTFLSSTRDLLYVTDTKDGIPEHRLEHLSCFFGGLLALGVETVDLPQQDADLHRWAAEGLTTTCWMTYAETQSGLGPEEAQFKVSFDRLHPLKWMDTVRAWENAGREGGVPPGVKAPELILGESRTGHRDYYLRTPGYYLRPEVCLYTYLFDLVKMSCLSDRREYLHHVEGHQG